MPKHKRLIHRLLPLLAIILAILALAYVSTLLDAQWFKNASSYEVTAVFDGDTIEVLMDGKREKIRFIGVDTPETGGHDTDIECYGHEATLFTKNALEGKRVKLKADPLSTNIDRYDRLLRYVYRAEDDYDVNLELLKQGYSPDYSYFPFERKQEFIVAAEQAERDRLGLWSACAEP